MHQFITENLIIRPLAKEDLSSLNKFEERNRFFWGNVSPLPQHQFNIDELLLDQSQGRSVRFILFNKGEEKEIIGTCNYTQIFRGPFQACYLGYKIAEEHQGKGWMREALVRTLKYMFEEQNMHRIMANYMPSNIRSEKLLLSLGFEKEGYAKNYLLVNGRWEDHVLTALINDNWRS